MADTDRLVDIIWEIKELIREARDIFAPTKASVRFESYPYPHIVGALDKDHGYLGGSFITFQDCIDELEAKDDEPEEDMEEP